MIKMTCAQLQTLNFSIPLVNKLLNTPFNPQISYRLKKVVDKLRIASRQVDEDAKKNLSEDVWAKRDEKGEIIRPKGNPFDFIISEDKREEFLKLRKEFEEREIIVDPDRQKIPFSELTGLTLSVTELGVIEPFVDFEEEAEKAPAQLGLSLVAPDGEPVHTPAPKAAAKKAKKK